MRALFYRAEVQWGHLKREGRTGVPCELPYLEIFMNWIDIDTRPLRTGYYLVGHAGHQEKLLFRGPDKEWIKGTSLGWQRLFNFGWISDDPKNRFNATMLIRLRHTAAKTY